MHESRCRKGISHDERANADKPFMELTAFSVGRRDFPTEKDIGNAKNCLTEERLFLDDRFGQYSQVIRQPFFSGVPEYGDRVVFSYGKHRCTRGTNEIK